MKIEIMEYNPDWIKDFEEEKINLLRFFGSHAVAIENIGSTVIPNQRAKPVIDIFIGVSPFAEQPFISATNFCSGIICGSIPGWLMSMEK